MFSHLTVKRNLLATVIDIFVTLVLILEAWGMTKVLGKYAYQTSESRSCLSLFCLRLT